MAKSNFDLEARLVDFSVYVIKIVDKLPNTYANKHLSSQLIRSATSCALNYGEAQAAESRKDFIHKMQLVLKELRESSVCMKILARTNALSQDESISTLTKEVNELILIFFKSIETAKSKLK